MSVALEIVIRDPIYLNGDLPVLTGFLKLITLPMWIPFWAIGKLFKARAVVRSGRRVYPVWVAR